MTSGPRARCETNLAEDPQRRSPLAGMDRCCTAATVAGGPTAGAHKPRARLRPRQVAAPERAEVTCGRPLTWDVTWPETSPDTASSACGQGTGYHSLSRPYLAFPAWFNLTPCICLPSPGAATGWPEAILTRIAVLRREEKAGPSRPSRRPRSRSAIWRRPPQPRRRRPVPCAGGRRTPSEADSGALPPEPTAEVPILRSEGYFWTIVCTCYFSQQ